MNDQQLAAIALQKKVWENLDSALANDYDMRGWTLEDIVLDLMCFAADLEDIEEVALLEPHVKSWLEARRTLQ